MPFVPTSYADSPAAYVRALIALLGDRDPVAVQRTTPSALREAVAGLTEAQARRPEQPDAWSIVQVVQHLVDSELVYGYRMRVIVAEDGPTLAGYDQDAWAEAFGTDGISLTEALDDFAALRTLNLRWLARQLPKTWARTGQHAERGTESVGQIVQLLAAHDLVHLRQVARIRGEVATP
ncbi:MAG: DinB family protein [Bacteroidota bacterium]